MTAIQQEGEALNTSYNEAQAKFDKAQKNLDFYTENEEKYVRDRSELQNRFDIIQNRDDHAAPKWYLVKVDLQKDIGIIDKMMELNRDDMAPHEVTLQQRKTDRNMALNKLEIFNNENAGMNDELGESDVKFLKSQNRRNMDHATKKKWIDRLGMEAFNNLVPL